MSRKIMFAHVHREKGFTLLELVVGFAVASIVAAGIALAWIAQQKSFMHETEANAVQNNLRAAVFILERDLRSAGYMENCPSKPCLSFVSANPTSLSFQRWNDSTGRVETISYRLYNSGAGGGQALGRQVDSNAIQPVAYNIDAINFVYIDRNNLVLPTPVPPDKLDNINKVEIAIVGRGSRATPIAGSGGRTFRNLQGNVIYTATSGNFVRRAILTRVYCRNNFPK